MHGYQMFQRLHAPSGVGLVWRVKQSQLYALLAKLEQAGYVESEPGLGESGPERRIFRLTPTGKETFLSWVQAPVAHARQLRMEFLAKLYCAERIGAETDVRLMTAQRTVCYEWLEALRSNREGLGEDPKFDRWVAQYRVGQIEAVLSWLDSLTQSQIPQEDA
jgi:DNA-binding PadR family transcriptional regulator